ncbi:MAG: carbohydrate ABC transporter permease [Firmicutes bacterium]|nr:carbohydrate ABC transporter permease [Bacillota bacterium]
MKKLSDKAIEVIIYILLSFAAFITLYPFIYVFSMSISSVEEVMKQNILLLPKGFSLESFKIVFRNKMFWQSYYNTIWYTVVGTTINVIMTVIAAYPLSKKRFIHRNFFMIMISFTMFFGGGLIPLYILVSTLGMYNTRWAIVIPGAVSAWYIIITRTFFQSIPDSLEESAIIDGAGDLKILTSIYLPLSKAILAVLILFHAVGHWNSFFSAMIFISDASKHPLQIYLRRILIEVSAEVQRDLPGSSYERAAYGIQLKYSSIIITILPIICVYPFLQKYFVKGVMIGSIKG